MANKTLFRSLIGHADSAGRRTERAGGAGYALPPKHALAQYAATGCLNTTFYARAEEQLDRVLDLCDARRRRSSSPRRPSTPRARAHEGHAGAAAGGAVAAGPGAAGGVFERVIDNAQMLRNFVQIVRSGVDRPQVARHGAEAAGARWLEQRDRRGRCSRASVGQRAVAGGRREDGAPEAGDAGARGALRLPDRPRRSTPAALPALVRRFEAFKAGDR